MLPTTNKERTEDELRSLVLKVGHDLFFSNGYSNTTAEAVARAVGISKKTLYKLFDSKEDLLRAAMQDVMQLIEQLTDRIYQEHDRPVPERLAALVTQISPHYARIRSPRILLDIQRNAPSVWSELETWRLYRYSKFRAIIEDGVIQGAIRSDIKIDDIMAYYTVMVNSCMEYSVYEESDVSSLDLYRCSMDVFIRGIFVSQPVGEATLDGWHAPNELNNIVRESQRLFSSLGYSKTTVDEIALNAGISKRTLYERFPKKSDIALTLLVHGARELRASADSLTYQHPATFQDELLTLIAAFVDSKGRLSERFVTDLSSALPIVHNRVMAWKRKFLRTELTRALEHGQLLGVVRHDINIPSTVLVLTIVIRNLLVAEARRSLKGMEAPPIDVIFSVVLGGISPRTEQFQRQQTR